MLQSFKAKFSEESLRANDDRFGEYLDDLQLNYDNVCSILMKLVTIEDMTKMNNYAQLYQTYIRVWKMGKTTKETQKSYKMKFRQLHCNPNDIISPHFDELVLVPKESLLEMKLPKPLILAQLPHPHEHRYFEDPSYRHVGQIREVNGDFVIFDCCEIPKNKLKNQWTVIFRSSRISFRLMYNALNALLDSSRIRKYLFPTSGVHQPMEATSLAEISLINTEIAANADQLQAVQNIISGPSALSPYIVFGPPGEYEER